MHFKKTIFDIFCPFYGLTLTYNCSAICQVRMLIFSPKKLILLLNFMWYNFFDPSRGQVVKKRFLAKALFAIFYPFQASLQIQFSQSSDFVDQFLIPLWKTTRKNLSKNGFGICLTKCILKKTIFDVFCQFLAQLLYVIFSVICLCRKLFNTIL